MNDLRQIIKDSDLNLIFSEKTANGSCWHWAILDQLKIHNIKVFQTIESFGNDPFSTTHLVA